MSGNFRDTKLYHVQLKRTRKRKTEIVCFVSRKKVHNFPTDVQKKTKRIIRKLVLVGIIPNQILFSFSSDKDRRTDSRIRRIKKPSAAPRRATTIRKTLGSIPSGAALCFSSDPASSSPTFVGAERKEN